MMSSSTAGSPADPDRRLLPTEHVYQTEVAGQPFTLATGRLAGQAGGAVTARVGDTLVLATATAAKTPRPDVDFFPLSVDMEERLYAAGRIPGSYYRREGRPSEAAILVARLIDRPLRPLFPSDFRNDVQVIVTALSSDGRHYIDIPAVIGASAALVISDIPFPEPIAAVRVGLTDGQYVINPTSDVMKASQLDLRVAGTASAILMVECGAHEVDEDTVLGAILAGHRAMQPLIALQEQMRAEVGKPKRAFVAAQLPDELVQQAMEFVAERIDGLFASAQNKQERYDALDALQAEWTARFEGDTPWQPADLGRALDEALKFHVRKRILDSQLRPDGRRWNEIRPLAGDVAVSPRAHGSGLFQRGETQVLSLATLGSLAEEQHLDTLRPEETKRFMHHYNFPPFSTGETAVLRGPRRREIGHGALGETALSAVIPPEDQFPYTIRVVAEVLSSNGSSSMASVCASSLALMDAGVPIAAPVAGIAMGLVTDPADPARYAVLTDIQGLEDHLGDMDFKVAGTRRGITALQMDIKLRGIHEDILRQALEQARLARLEILDFMASVLPAPRSQLSPYAPRITTINVPPDLIGKLIGPGGKTVRGLQEETGTKIDIQEDGTVYIAAAEGAAADEAYRRIMALTETPQPGKTYTGRVVRTTEFGAFVEILPGVEGMVHISQLSNERVEDVTSVVQVGDEILVMVTDISGGKVRLSRQAVLEGWTLDEARARDRGVGGSRDRSPARRGPRR